MGRRYASGGPHYHQPSGYLFGEKVSSSDKSGGDPCLCFSLDNLSVFSGFLRREKWICLESEKEANVYDVSEICVRILQDLPGLCLWTRSLDQFIVVEGGGVDSM